MMEKMSCPNSFKDLIMHYVSSVSYFVLINGFPTAYFHPYKGLGQGDPFSPYLFLIYAKGFLVMI